MSDFDMSMEQFIEYFERIGARGAAYAEKNKITNMIEVDIKFINICLSHYIYRTF